MGRFDRLFGRDKQPKKISPRAFVGSREAATLRGMSEQADFDALTSGLISVESRLATAPIGAVDTIRQECCTLYGGNESLWPVPAAETEFLGLDTNRAILNISFYSSARLIVNNRNAASAGAYITLEFYNPDSSNFERMLGDIGIDLSVGTVKFTGWKQIPAEARLTSDTGTILRLIAGGGDGVTVPEFGTCMVQFRTDIFLTTSVDEMAI